MAQRRDMKVAIVGGSVAAACCALLLERRGMSPRIMAGDRPAAPVVMLSATALALLREMVGRPDLFARQPRIARRIVAWGGNPPVAMPHDAIVVSGDALSGMLPIEPGAATEAVDLTVRTLAHRADTMVRFGDRGATAKTVRLRDADASQDCWIESLDTGWLFLIPSDDEGQAWLLSVGEPIEAVLPQSRHIRRRVTVTDAPSTAFDPTPRLAAALTGADWIACGSAAIAFDPIAGDGTAQAVRAAVLAAAVLGGIADGGDADGLKAHYGAVLTAAMRRHLQLCAPFYRSGGIGPWWRSAHDALATGHDECTRRLSVTPPPRYVLHGYDLVARELVA